MLRYKAYKYRIYPSKPQETMIAKTIGCSRFVFNYFLAKWHDTYEQTGKGLTYSKCSKELPKMKKNEATVWLKEVDSVTLQSSLENLADGFSRFFKKQNQRPQFKSKSNPIQSYTTKNTNNSIVLYDRFVKLPKLGLVKLKNRQYHNGRVIKETIRRTVSGKYFVSFILAEIRNINTFNNPAQLQAFAGLEPAIYQSGQLDTRGKMVKRGSSHLRWALIQAAIKVARYSPTFKAYFRTKLTQGKHYNVAIFHVAKKLIRVLFYLLQNNEDFEEDKLR